MIITTLGHFVEVAVVLEYNYVGINCLLDTQFCNMGVLRHSVYFDLINVPMNVLRTTMTKF